ncbi:MAG: cupin domain-containing protein [Lachnospiraceae bacterium]|nr:cupin domain-containing protein [Lachnospiraceae bacterium]
MTSNIEIGAHLRTLRERKGYTIKELADNSSLSIGFISQVERGKTDPSLASLRKLTTALDISMKELFEYEGEPHTVIKKGEGSIMQVHGTNCELLCPFEEKQMEPLIKHIQPHSQSGIVDGHIGEEFVLILSGSLEIIVGNERYKLEKGDSLYFKAAQDHGWENLTDKWCDAFWVACPPIYT